MVFVLEGLSVSTHATSQGKLLSSCGVFHVQRALCPLQGLGPRSNWTLGQLGLGCACDTLEIVVAGVAEVGRAEAEVDGH